MKLHAATQRVGQHPLRDIAGEIVLAREQQPLQLRRTGEFLAAAHQARRVHRLRTDLRAPAANRIEVLQAKAQRIEPRMAARALRLFPMLLQPLTKRKTILRRVFLRESARVRRRRRWRLTEQFLQHPFAAQHRAGPLRIRREREHRAHAEHAAAILVRQIHAPQFCARDVQIRQPVMLRERLVEVSVVRVQQRQQARILANHRREKFNRLPIHGLAQFGRELPKASGVGLHRGLEFAHAQPLAREILRQRARLRVAEHPLHLRLQRRALVQLILRRQREQLRIGHG